MMMKKILLPICLLLLFFLSVRTSFAQEIPTPTPIPYVLPYPGILPDHPLWFIKAFRDRVITFLISSPVKKSEFSLAQADKRLSAGMALLKKGKEEVGVSTISKGENYLVLAVSQAKEAKIVGKDASLLLDVLFRATKKHQAVLIEEATAHPQIKDKLTVEQKRVAEQENLVNDLRK